MKRNLLSSAIIIALMTLGATGCDDNNVKTEATSATSSQPATPAPSQTPETQSGESPAQPPAAKPETPVQPEVDAEEVYSEKMDVYIDCFNKLQLPVQHSLARYADWVKDFKKRSDRERESGLWHLWYYGVLHNELPERDETGGRLNAIT